MQSALEKEERFMCSLEEDGESLWFLDTHVAVPGSLGSVLTRPHKVGAAVPVLGLGNLGTGLQGCSEHRGK